MRRPAPDGRRATQRHLPGAVLVCVALGGVLLGGCGYTVGNAYQAEIRSVYVPMFKSESFRRGLEFQLTEAVHKQIQQRTPFRLVKEPLADTQLTGEIVDIRKNALSETQNDDPRELQVAFVVNVKWENLRTGELLGEQCLKLSPAEVQFVSQADFAPEVGQSQASAYQQVIDRMARDIIDMMEAPW